MQWKTLSSADEGVGASAACLVCGSTIFHAAPPMFAYRPDFEHGDTPGSVEFLQERHEIDLSDEQGLTCSSCRARVDDLLQ